MNDCVIRISLDWHPGLMLFHPMIEGMVQEQIRQQWRDNPTLRRSLMPCGLAAFLILRGGP
jgi:hypothetical protein